MSENFPDVADGDLRVGFAPRMVAAVWFAATALIPIAFFLVSFGQGILFGPFFDDDGAGSSFFVLLPICMAAFFGFTIGSRILDKRRVTRECVASLLGGVVAVASYVGMMSCYVVIQLLNDAPGRAAWAINMALVGAIFLGWLIVMAGVFGGWMLFRWASSRGYPPEVSRVRWSTACCLNLLAAAVLLLVALFLCSVPWSRQAAKERARQSDLSSMVSKGLIYA
jgi:hypothetical protein